MEMVKEKDGIWGKPENARILFWKMREGGRLRRLMMERSREKETGSRGILGERKVGGEMKRNDGDKEYNSLEFPAQVREKRKRRGRREKSSLVCCPQVQI